MKVASATAVEMVRFLPETPRATDALNAMRRAASSLGIELSTTQSYQGTSPWLMVWGPGAPERQAAMRAHVAKGGHAVALDLAYWSRHRKVRLTVDAPHPQALIMAKDYPPDRLLLDSPPIVDNWRNPHGQVIIAGIGRKATVQYGAETVEAWEAAMADEARRRWPLRQVVRRPKPLSPGPPDHALRGASLVVTWHSNIAVDAVRLGIPAVCRDGAAAAVCPSEIPDDPRPLPQEVRRRFLSNLAWFQWDPANEARACWLFLQGLLP